jgi:cell division inhibitor SulA
MDDLYMAAEALKTKLSLISIKREANWLTPLAENQKDSLWRATQQNDRAQTYFMRDLMTQYVQPTWNDWWKRP